MAASFYSEFKERKHSAGTGAPTGAPGTRGSSKDNGMNATGPKSGKGAPLNGKRGVVDHGAIRERTANWPVPT